MHDERVLLHGLIGHYRASGAQNRRSIVGKNDIDIGPPRLQFCNRAGDNLGIAALPVARLDARKTVAESLRDFDQVFDIPDRIDDERALLLRPVIKTALDLFELRIYALGGKSNDSEKHK